MATKTFGELDTWSSPDNGTIEVPSATSMPIRRVKRVKTGCITCRIRRVKCDETKPDCSRCTSTGRRCDGYSSLPFSRRDFHAASQASSNPTQSDESSEYETTAPLARIVSDPAFGDVLEKRYFQFFRHKTVASTNSIMESRFWDRILLQICHTEPAVKHAVLALSSLHQLSEARHDGEVALRHQRFADQNYQKALSAAQDLLHSSTPQDIDRVLIACLIFTCYENIRGNYLASQMHTGSGRAIMAQHHDRLRRLSRRNDLNEIQALFARLDVAAMAFSISNARYPYDLESFFATNPNLTPDAFDSVEEARAPLIDNVRWCMVRGQEIFQANLQNDRPKIPLLESERQKVQTNLQRWSERFERVASTDPNASAILICTLRAWHLLASIEVAANWHGSEMRFDAFTADYDRLVTNAEEVVALLAQKPDHGSFGFDLGVTICLFGTVQRCRDPYIRRRALKAMYAGPKQEGVWGLPGAARSVEQWVLFEEAGLGVVEKASDVPEWRRVINMDAAVNVELGVAELIFEVTPSTGHDEELGLGFLGVLKFEDEGNVDARVRPFSMGLGHEMSYRARYSQAGATAAAASG